jgi:hypothetical protein
MKTFAEQMSDFDARRCAARITDAELAGRAGVAPSAISHYRHKRRQPLVDGWARLNSALDELIKERAAELGRL